MLDRQWTMTYVPYAQQSVVPINSFYNLKFKENFKYSAPDNRKNTLLFSFITIFFDEEGSYDFMKYLCSQTITRINFKIVI